MTSTGLAFYPLHNTGRKKDADEFEREAKRFAERHGGHTIGVNNRAGKGAMRDTVINALAQTRYATDMCCDDHFDHGLEWVAFFCHGWARGIQFGFDISNVDSLSEQIALVSNKDVVVPLYCCSTASTLGWLKARGKGPGGDRGFADELRDSLCENGATHCVVDAHTTAGHTTRNPNVRRFAGDGSPSGGVGGNFIVERRSPEWRPWVRALRGDLRLAFPFLTIGQVHALLADD